MMNASRTQHSPGFLRIVGAVALAIVLAVGGSAAIAGFLTDWGRYGNPDSGPSLATQPSQTAAPSATTAPSSSSPTSHGNEQTATALHAIATAENQVRHGKVFNLRDQVDGMQRLWSAKVANPDSRQFNLTIAHDGSSVVGLNEDETPDDDVRTLRSAKIPLEDAINIAIEQARGKGNLTSLEIDIKNGATGVWQIEFGGAHGATVLVDGTTVLVDAGSGEVIDTDPGAA
jgi:Peptidase propeptide and YPEB domain